MHARTVIPVLLVAAFLVVSGCLGEQDKPPASGDTQKTVTAPAAGGTVSPTTATVGDAVAFDASLSDLGGSTTASYAWGFGDGATGTGKSTTHKYTAPGRYIAVLDVTNEAGSDRNDEALLFVDVAPAPLTASSTPANTPVSTALGVSKQVIQKGTEIEANASGSFAWVANDDFDTTRGVAPDNVPLLASTKDIAKFTFDWGDGSAKTETGNTTFGAKHTYATAGVYTLKLTATDAAGRTGSSSATIVVLPTAPSVGGYKFKDVFVTATISGPQSFDPGFDYESAGGHIIEQAYETLFTTERGNTNKILPLLAAELPSTANGGISSDGLTYTIKVRPNVKFHDGTAVDAAAVKFSLDRLVLLNDPSSGAPVVTPLLKGADAYRSTSDNSAANRTAWLGLNAVEVVDAMTVRLHLDRADAAVFQRLAFYASSIVSPTAFKACREERVPLWGVCQTADGLPPAGKGITRDPWADTNMVGTGPFKMRKWLPGDRVILDRNDQYWGEKPAMKTVIVQYVDDLNTRILMLKNGDADEIYIPSSDLDRVKPSLVDIADFIPADTLIIDAFFFNYDVTDSANCPKVNGAASCKLFQDMNVRKAFSLAFDYNDFHTNVWKNRAKGLAGVIPRGMPGYDPTIPLPAQNLPGAETAIAQTVCATDNACEVDVYYNTGNNVRKGASQILADNMAKIGVKVNVKELPFNTLLDKSQKAEIPLWALGWAPDYIATDDYIVPFLDSEGTYPVAQNFKDTELDALIDAALRDTNPVTQAEKFKEINRKAVERYVDIWLDQRTQTHVERKYVEGYYYDPLQSGSPNTGDYASVSKV